MNTKRNEMPLLSGSIRNKCFSEVALGYTEKQALSEASRCLNCKAKPCIKGCPVNIAIPEFIQRICEKDYEGAYEIIAKTSSLPAVCGRVCPQETQCEMHCVRGKMKEDEPVAIGRLERFVADKHFQLHSDSDGNKSVIKNGIKVAVIGSGPAGLTCAGYLCDMGYSVTIFEALHVAGGVLMYGIPEFRLPKDIVRGEINNLLEKGVEIITNVVVGKTITIDELQNDGYKAIFIGSGAGLPRFMGIKGENLNGVYSANEFLTRVNLMKAYEESAATPIKRSSGVAVVGGGNVAMDAARCAKRLGADKVSIVYRRSREELPARREEVTHAMEEGIDFLLLTNPCEITDNGSFGVSGMKCVKMELGEPDSSGRRSPKEIVGSQFYLECDCVIMALGTSPNPLIHSTTEGLSVNNRGCIIANEEGLTQREHIYAGGDAVTGAATVILAMGAGRKAAIAIDKELR